MTLLGSGHADAAGEWSFTWSVPLDPLLAEEPEHFQAFVRRPILGGAVLSTAVHLRLLGSRAYTSSAGSNDPSHHASGEFSIVSLTKGELVARIDFGMVARA
jgi:hypothetical protein